MKKLRPRKIKWFAVNILDGREKVQLNVMRRENVSAGENFKRNVDHSRSGDQKCGPWTNSFLSPGILLETQSLKSRGRLTESNYGVGTFKSDNFVPACPWEMNVSGHIGNIINGTWNLCILLYVNHTSIFKVFKNLKTKWKTRFGYSFGSSSTSTP